MTKDEFKEIQLKLGLTNKAIGALVFKSEAMIEFWRSGRHPVELNAAARLREIVEKEC